jgi:NAD(P)-dependent dehydrogenase (short-subunit alcohol dehydrogenase family)/acyl carrier protein
MDAGPQRIEQMLTVLMDLFERGELSLPPIRAWDIRRAPQALRFMSQARHVGKIVLTRVPSDFDSRGTVLITGGTGGLGSLFARHLVTHHDVARLLLASRAGESSPGVDRLKRELEGLGASVQIASCDVSQRDELRELIASIGGEHPLRGVVHAAGVLDDGLIGSLTPERMRGVLAPKLDAAWYLHELTAELDLDAFVLFSSVAGTLGSSGQGNYAAANAFLEALACHRRALGLPAVAMAWGPWAQSSGMTSRLASTDLARMASSGMLTLSPEQGLELFDVARTDDRALTVLARLDVSALRERASRQELPSVLTGLIRASTRDEGVRKAAQDSLATNFARAPEAERGRIVLEFVCAQSAAVLGHSSPEAIDSAKTFKDLGFDSLAAVELRNRLGASTGLQLPATLIFDYPTLGALTGHIRGELHALVGDPPPAVEPNVRELVIRLSSMSAEQAHRSGMATRLQEILDRWVRVEEEAEGDSAEEDLSAIGDEEIFELIDREFGVL